MCRNYFDVDSLGFYGNEISGKKKWEKLVPEKQEFEQLVLQMRNGSLKARNEIIERNWALVCKCVRKFNFKNVEFDDMLQEGLLRFVEICENYSPEKAALSTYLWLALNQHMIRKSANMPERLYKFSISFKQTVDFLTDKYGRDPSYSEIAEFMCISESVLSEKLDKVRTFQAISLDAPCGDSESGDSLCDFCCFDQVDCPEDKAIRKEEIRLIRKAVNRLNERERQVVILRNNLDNSEERILSFREIGERMNLSYETVRKTEASANLKLKNFLIREGVGAA